MTEPIGMGGAIRPILPMQPSTGAGAASKPAGKDFKALVLDNLNEVNRLQGEADRRVEDLVTGRTDNVTEVLTAVNKAGIAFDLLMEVRNKLIEAYQEIQQMRV